MRIARTDERITEIDADAIAVGIEKNGELPRAARDLDAATGGALSRLIASQEVSGKAGEKAVLLAPAGVPALVVDVSGWGDRGDLDRGQVFRGTAAAAKRLATRPRNRVAFYLGDDWPAEWIESSVCGALVGCQGQDLYRSEKKLVPFEQAVWFTPHHVALETGRILGESINLTRRLVNEPPSEINPAGFAAGAEQVATDCGLDIEIWEPERLEMERCHALLAVGRGSDHAPRLIVLEYRGGKPEQPPLAFVGKGVTFDSGGLSLKPTDSMKTMKCDMAGAATVLGAMQAIAQLQLPIHVIGLIGLAENMVGGNAYKLGDVLRSRNGKTIEVLNTDAEGRLVLADVLDVAVERGAARIVDLATLTGACVVALGADVAGLMTNDQDWCQRVADAARVCGEPAWQLPMFSEYSEQIRSDVADLKNVGEGRWGGAITAAKFLEEFVAGRPWTHIDIAGPSFLEKAKPWCDAGGSGAFVQTLVQLARQLAAAGD